MANVMVTGGAGYIGSHVMRELSRHMHNVLAYDNLSTGHGDAVNDYPLVIGDIRDGDYLASVFHSYNIDAVVHLAAVAEVSQSMKDPGLYYDVNVGGTLSLLRAMATRGIDRFVFASSCAVYGRPACRSIDELQATEPMNAYGSTKLACEQMLHWFYYTHAIRSISLRFFNAAGAHPSGLIGEDHRPESHVIPRMLRTLIDNKSVFYVAGRNHDTPDGTCIRDYTHVCDIASAHVAALNALVDRRVDIGAYNVGSGRGKSILELLTIVRQVTGFQLPRVDYMPRRAGDPGMLMANTTKIRSDLDWAPKYEVHDIIAHAWQWHKNNPDGYGD